VGTETVTRRVTALKPGRYKATINLPGVNATVTPSVLSFSSKGQTKSIKVKFNRKNAPLGKTDFGSLYLRGPGSTQARLPIAVKPEAVDAPDEITGTGVSGSKSYQIKPGFSGPFPVTVYGLDEANEETGEVAASKPNASARFASTVPAGTKVARLAVASDEASADIDLYLYRIVDGVPQLVATSGGPTGVESVTLVDPEPGEYLTAILPFSDPPGQASTTFVYRDFQVDPAAAGNLTVTPANATVTQDRPLTLKAAWSGLTAGKAYLGWVGYVDGSGTLVAIN
jgi:hypothetical protein